MWTAFGIYICARSVLWVYIVERFFLLVVGRIGIKGVGSPENLACQPLYRTAAASISVTVISGSRVLFLYEPGRAVVRLGWEVVNK